MTTSNSPTYSIARIMLKWMVYIDVEKWVRPELHVNITWTE